MNIGTKPFHERVILDKTIQERTYPRVVLVGRIPGLITYCVHECMLDGVQRYVFKAYPFRSVKLIWQEVYTHELPMCNVEVWARYFPLSRLESALRQGIVSL